MGSKYNDEDENLGGDFQNSAAPFKNPESVKTFPGYGASSEDLERGFIKPDMAESPEYDLKNYKGRATEPKRSDEDESNGLSLPKDYEFRMKGRESKGLFTRPVTSTER